MGILDQVPSDLLQHSVARGSLWGLGSRTILLVASLLATPFTIRLLGPTEYGLWSLIQALMGYLIIADVGMASASTKFAGEQHVRHDNRGEAAVIWTALAITLGVTSIAVLGLTVISPFLVTQILHVPPRLRASGILAIRIVGATVLARSAAGTLNTPQMVRIRWCGLTIAVSGPALIQVVAMPFVLAATYANVVAAASVTAGAAILSLLINAVLAAKLQPRLLRPHLDGTALLPLIRYGGALVLSGFAAIPLTTADRFLLAYFRSLTDVAYYSVAMALATLMTIVPGAVTAPLFPAFVRLHATKGFSQRNQLYRQALQAIFLTMTPSAIMVAFLAHPFLGLWAGNHYVRSSIRPFLILLIGAWFNALAQVPYQHLLASGRTALIAKIHLIELVPYVILCAGMIVMFGATGAALAWSARVIVDAVLFFVTVARDGIPSRPTPTHGVRSVVAMVTLAALALLLSTVTFALTTRVALAVMMLMLYILGIWKIILTADERTGARLLADALLPKSMRRRT